MEGLQTVRTALISVYNKTGLEPLLDAFRKYSVEVISTGGTAAFLRAQGFTVQDVSDLTGFPEILDGRVKTLNPKIFGGLLALRSEEKHMNQLAQQGIQPIDCVVVDLYPFHETRLNPESTEVDIKSQIDIGGVSLIRAGAKNFEFVTVVSSYSQYEQVARWMEEGQGALSRAQRKQLAGEALRTSANYDLEISDWISGNELPSGGHAGKMEMRYGENPHQAAAFYGNLHDYLEQLSGKPLSYNNLNDADAALGLIREFQNWEQPVVAIVKHTQACGLASGTTVADAWNRSLACDPSSAFGGVIASNREIDVATAEAMHGLFFEVLIAPGFSPDALTLLKVKKNRILLKDSGKALPDYQSKTLLGGQLVQNVDGVIAGAHQYQVVSGVLNHGELDLQFAEIAVKHLKSNAIALVKDGQLIGAGSGQTSRVDAVAQAIAKAQKHGFDIRGCILASDAFFPFPDNLELAAAAGVGLVVQPGGSVKDEENIQYCREHNLTMLFTGIRHFKH